MPSRTSTSSPTVRHTSPETQRAVIVLFYFEDFLVAEIAHILERPQAIEVYSDLHRASTETWRICSTNHRGLMGLSIDERLPGPGLGARPELTDSEIEGKLAVTIQRGCRRSDVAPARSGRHRLSHRAGLLVALPKLLSESNRKEPVGPPSPSIGGHSPSPRTVGTAGPELAARRAALHGLELALGAHDPQRVARARLRDGRRPRRQRRHQRRGGARRPARCACASPTPPSMPPSTTVADELTYEAATARLEAIISRLDSGEAGLRETLALVREGRGLVEFCAAELDAVGRGLEELRLDELVARLEQRPPVARHRAHRIRRCRALFDERLADLPLRDRPLRARGARARDVSAFARRTTVIHAARRRRGGRRRGRHLRRRRPGGAAGRPGPSLPLAGELDARRLLRPPRGPRPVPEPPARDVSRHYRRWAYESRRARPRAAPGRHVAARGARPRAAARCASSSRCASGEPPTLEPVTRAPRALPDAALQARPDAATGRRS